MRIILILFCLFAALVGYRMEKNIYNPITSFFAYWFLVFCLLIYGEHYFEVNQTSGRAYLIILIGLISYFAGCIFVIYFNSRIRSSENGILLYDTDSSLRYNLIYVIYGLVLIYLLYNSITTIRLLVSGNSLADIRKLYTDREGYNVVRKSSLNLVFKNFISTPVVYLSLPIAVVEFFSGSKDKKLFFLTIGMAALWVLTSGGRSIILWLSMYFVCAYFIYNKHNKLGKKNKTSAFVLIALLGVVLIIVSNFRRSNFSLIREIFIYYAAPIPHFDYRISEIDRLFPNVYGYGMSSLNGLIYPILFLLENIGLVSYPEKYLLIRDLSFELLEETVDIGVRMNAFATMFYQPYLDGRILGVIIFSTLFGMLCNWIYLSMKNNLSKMMVVLYLLIIQKLLSSVVRFYFFQPAHVIGLIAVFLLYENHYFRMCLKRICQVCKNFKLRLSRR